jgi:biphenyl 2,3-dioxygenase subunit beta
MGEHMSTYDSLQTVLSEISAARVAAMVRQHEIEQFYYEEAALLDAHEYDPWVELFTDDATYFVPIRRTRARRQLEQEFTQRGEMGFMSETKASLRGRAIKFNSGRAWAEDPPSRTRHLITNIRVLDDNGEELRVASNFHLYRTRLKSEEDSWIGSRIDRLRRDRPGGPGGPETDTFRIAERTVYLEQTVLLSRNLSNFF